jgi:hypothetical protein
MPSLGHSEHPEHPDASQYRGSWTRLVLGAALRAVINPRVALDLLKAGWAFRRLRWWADPPFLPLPDRTYLRWRMYTAYGSEDAVPPLDDLIRFARWRRETMGL